jgi:cysteine protease ATG4
MNNKILLIGNFYKEFNDDFISDYKSRIILTYRYNIPSLLNYSSDIGWGCTIRSGQMILAESLLRMNLGRDWRLYNNKSHSLAHKHILNYFIDVPSKDHYFSIQNITHYGLKYKKNIGDWYGPETISKVLRDIVNSNNRIKLKVYIPENNDIIIDDLRLLSPTLENILILIPLRLGLSNINYQYVNYLFKFLELSQSVGFIGGKPTKSFYFIGYQNNNFIYLDPHHNQNLIDHENFFPKINDLLSYHDKKINLIDSSIIDPSLSIGFFIKNENDFNKFKNSIQQIFKDNNIFNINQSKVNYNYKSSDIINDEWEFI